jgi:hypothetical protein
VRPSPVVDSTSDDALTPRLSLHLYIGKLQLCHSLTGNDQAAAPLGTLRAPKDLPSIALPGFRVMLLIQVEAGYALSQIT